MKGLKKFKDYSKDRIEDLGVKVIDYYGEAKSYPIAFKLHRFRGYTPAYALFPEGDEATYLVVNRHGKIILHDIGMTDVNIEAVECTFDKIDRQYYNQLIEYWTNLYLDDVMKERGDM